MLNLNKVNTKILRANNCSNVTKPVRDDPDALEDSQCPYAAPGLAPFPSDHLKCANFKRPTGYPNKGLINFRPRPPCSGLDF